MVELAARALLFASLSPLALSAPAMAQRSTARAGVRKRRPETPTSRQSSSRARADPTAPSPTVQSRSTSSGPRRSRIPARPRPTEILNQLVPSFNFPQPSIADGSDTLRPATLRGLSPDQTLVLVNGKRRHVSALAEHQRDRGPWQRRGRPQSYSRPCHQPRRSASRRCCRPVWFGRDRRRHQHPAQERRSRRQGKPDLRRILDDHQRRRQGHRASARWQRASRSSTRPIRAISSPTRTGSGRAHDGTQATAAVNLGLPIGPNGFINITGEFRDRDATNRAGYDLRPNFNRPTAAFDPREATFNRLQFRFGDPKSADYDLVPQRRHRGRAGLGSLCVRDIRPSRRDERGKLAPAEQ